MSLDRLRHLKPHHWGARTGDQRGMVACLRSAFENVTVSERAGSMPVAYVAVTRAQRLLVIAIPGRVEKRVRSILEKGLVPLRVEKGSAVADGSQQLALFAKSER